MKQMNLNIQSWRPTHHPKPFEDECGGYTSQFYEAHAIVTVFAYAGGMHGRPFTTLEAYYDGQMHKARLSKYYHPRWHGRLSRQFDWQISQTQEG